LEEFPTINFGEGFDWKEEVFRGIYPFAVLVDDPSGNQAMEMGMISQLLVPGVKDSDKTQLSFKVMTRVIGKILQGIGDGLIEQVIAGPLVMEEERVEFVRQGKNVVEIGSRQELGFSLLQPAGLCHHLTFWAMSIPT